MYESNPREITVEHSGEVWLLRWVENHPRTGMVQQRCRALYGMDTREQAVQDAVEYFGGLVKPEDIR